MNTSLFLHLKKTLYRVNREALLNYFKRSHCTWHKSVGWWAQIWDFGFKLTLIYNNDCLQPSTHPFTIFLEKYKEMRGGLRLSQYCMCVVFHVSHTFQSFFPKTAVTKNEHHSVTGQNKHSQQDSGFFFSITKVYCHYMCRSSQVLISTKHFLGLRCCMRVKHATFQHIKVSGWKKKNLL